MIIHFSDGDLPEGNYRLDIINSSQPNILSINNDGTYNYDSEKIWCTEKK